MGTEQHPYIPARRTSLFELVQLCRHPAAEHINQLRMQVVAFHEFHDDSAGFRFFSGPLNISSNTHNRIMRGKNDTNRLTDAVT
ncbi:hypothetical protein D3C86_2025550 [compost metagenome]